MTDYRTERQSYARRAGGDEGGLRWEDCVKRDVRKAGEGDIGRKDKRQRRVANTIR